MKKALRWTAAIILGLILLGATGLFIGGNIWLERFLAGPRTFDNTTIRVYDPDVTWFFAVRADSVRIDAPGLSATAVNARIDPALLESALRLLAVGTVRIDSIAVNLQPDTVARPDTSGRPWHERAIAFPEFVLPVDVGVTVGHTRLLRADSGLLAAEGLYAVAQRTGAALTIDSLRSPRIDPVAPGITAEASWDDSLFVKGFIRLGWRDDSVRIALRHRKRDLLRGRDTVTVGIKSSAPYEALLPSGVALPHARDLELQARLHLDSLGYTASARLQTAIARIARVEPRIITGELSPQQLTFTIDLSDGAGQWRLHSRGQRTEMVRIDGGVRLPPLDSLDTIARRFLVTARGVIQGVPLRLAKNAVMLDATVEHAAISADSLAAAVHTADSSRVEAAIVRVDDRWRGPFTADISPRERWVRAFLDTNVTYDAARIEGRLDGTTVSARSWFTDVLAYGATADSLFARHSVSDSVYRIHDGTLWAGDIGWNLGGEIVFADGFPPMRFFVDHPRFGAASWAMPRENYMEATVDNLQLERLPLTYLKDVLLYQTQATGSFSWDMNERTGAADFNGFGFYRDQRLEASLAAAWTAETLTVRSASLALNASSLLARAAVALRGDYFYELETFTIDDIFAASVEAIDFRVAQALELFLSDPPITGGVLDGRLSYSPERGFRGVYRLDSVEAPAVQEMFTGISAAVEGRGDSLIFRAATDSDQSIYRDSVWAAATGVLADTQQLSLHVIAGDSLHLYAAGALANQRDLQADFCAFGAAALPGQSGALRELYLEGRTVVPLDNPTQGLFVQTDTLRGVYAIADLDTQLFVARVHAADGAIDIPSLRVTNKQGERLRGQARYELASGRLEAALRGESFAIGIPGIDRILAKGIDVTVTSDSANLVAAAELRRIEGELAQPPLKAAGQLRNVSALYRQPLASRTQAGLQPSRRIPSLELSATLERSEVSYRLRSFEALQGLFRRGPETQQGGGGREQPLRLEVDMQTDGDSNQIDTDILRMNYVGNVSVTGTLPYVTLNGRVTGLSGEIGVAGQSYDITTLQVKWLNEPLEEGAVSMEAAKELAVDCEPETQDSCTVFTRFSGELENLQFSYETDCGGEFGAGANVAAIVFSVRRGCYSPAFSAGVEQTYGQQALALLEPTVSRGLTQLAERLTGDFIAGATLTGLGTLAADSVTQPLAIEVVTRELWRFRFRAQGGYRVNAEEAANPFAGKLALEYRPPAPGFIDSKRWRERLENNVVIEASVETDPEQAESTQEDEIQQRIGIIYDFNFWKLW